MLISYTKIKKYPTVLLHLFGIKPQHFQDIWRLLEPLWATRDAGGRLRMKWFKPPKKILNTFMHILEPKGATPLVCLDSAP